MPRAVSRNALSDRGSRVGVVVNEAALIVTPITFPGTWWLLETRKVLHYDGFPFRFKRLECLHHKLWVEAWHQLAPTVPTSDLWALK